MYLDADKDIQSSDFKSFSSQKIPLKEEIRLSDLLKYSTKDIHVEAERSGVIQEIISGRVTLAAYLLLLRCLQPIYQKMEQLLEENKHLSFLSDFADSAMYRSAALESDIRQIITKNPELDLDSNLVANNDYLARLIYIEEHKQLDLLLAHLYVRYLGDLSGGQIIERILSKRTDFINNLSFYKYPKITNILLFKDNFRNAMDKCANFVNITNVTHEASRVFRYNIDLSKRVYEEYNLKV